MRVVLVITALSYQDRRHVDVVPDEVWCVEGDVALVIFVVVTMVWFWRVLLKLVGGGFKNR